MYAISLYGSLKHELEEEHTNLEALKEACVSIAAYDSAMKIKKAMDLIESAYDELIKKGSLGKILESNETKSMSDIVGVPTNLNREQK